MEENIEGRAIKNDKVHEQETSKLKHVVVKTESELLKAKEKLRLQEGDYSELTMSYNDLNDYMKKLDDEGKNFHDKMTDKNKDLDKKDIQMNEIKNSCEKKVTALKSSRNNLKEKYHELEQEKIQMKIQLDQIIDKLTAELDSINCDFTGIKKENEDYEKIFETLKLKAEQKEKYISNEEVKYQTLEEEVQRLKETYSYEKDVWTKQLEDMSQKVGELKMTVQNKEVKVDNKFSENGEKYANLNLEVLLVNNLQDDLQNASKNLHDFDHGLNFQKRNDFDDNNVNKIKFLDDISVIANENSRFISRNNSKQGSKKNLDYISPTNTLNLLSDKNIDVNKQRSCSIENHKILINVLDTENLNSSRNNLDENKYISNEQVIINENPRTSRSNVNKNKTSAKGSLNKIVDYIGEKPRNSNIHKPPIPKNEDKNIKTGKTLIPYSENSSAKEVLRALNNNVINKERGNNLQKISFCIQTDLTGQNIEQESLVKNELELQIKDLSDQKEIQEKIISDLNVKLEDLSKMNEDSKSFIKQNLLIKLKHSQTQTSSNNEQVPKNKASTGESQNANVKDNLSQSKMSQSNDQQHKELNMMRRKYNLLSEFAKNLKQEYKTQEKEYNDRVLYYLGVINNINTSVVTNRKPLKSNELPYDKNDKKNVEDILGKDAIDNKNGNGVNLQSILSQKTQAFQKKREERIESVSIIAKQMLHESIFLRNDDCENMTEGEHLDVEDVVIIRECVCDINQEGLPYNEKGYQNKKIIQKEIIKKTNNPLMFMGHKILNYSEVIESPAKKTSLPQYSLIHDSQSNSTSKQMAKMIKTFKTQILEHEKKNSMLKKHFEMLELSKKEMENHYNEKQYNNLHLINQLTDKIQTQRIRFKKLVKQLEKISKDNNYKKMNVVLENLNGQKKNILDDSNDTIKIEDLQETKVVKKKSFWGSIGGPRTIK